MDQLLEVTDIKTEPTESTSSDKLEISTEMQVNSFKQEDNYLIHTDLNIKIKTREDESEFPVIAGTSYEACSYNDMKIGMEEPLIKVEYDNLLDELMQDPLDIGNDIKDKEYFTINLNQSKLGIKTENFLETDEKSELQQSGSNQGQDQLLIRNDADCKDKKYVCNDCNKTFRWQSHLDDHVRIHTGEKPFICDICEKQFIQKSHLNSHMLIHRGEKPHVCDVCEKVFREKSKLKKHRLIHSGAKPFTCNMCDKSFRQKNDLITHKRIHTGDKPYTCDLCKKEFAVKSNLVRHRLLHTGEKPYSCDVCSKSFTQKAGLNKHKRVHKN